MRYLLALSILGIIGNTSYAQIVSQFTFESDPVTTADVGPDATSVSSSAFSDAGGAGGTNGLNAGLPKQNITMVIPGSPTFDLDGIDVSFDFHREENSGDFFVRGSSLIIRGTSNLSVTYRVEDGGGGFTTINSGNVFSIPNDDVYRNYRFGYTPCDGLGVLIVDGAMVWSNDGPDNRNMYWVGAGDVTICRGIDGTGFNDTFFDNLIIGEVDCSLLPVELVNFKVESVDVCQNRISWTTKSERNNDRFLIERSSDGQNWEPIATVDGKGNSTVINAYSYIDHITQAGLFYYRVVQVDFDGREEVYGPKSVEAWGCGENQPYPNPTNGIIFASGIELGADLQLYNVSGVSLIGQVAVDYIAQTIDMTSLAAGRYVLVINGEAYAIVKLD